MIILDTKPQQQETKTRFIFDHKWSKMNRCDEVIQNSWNVQVEGSRMFKFHKNVKQCRKGLLEWRKKESTNPRIQIECIKGEMENL